MLVKSQKLKCLGKEEEKKVSKRTGNEYLDKMISFEDTDGTVITTHLNNDVCYNKATKDKMYSLIYYVTPTGNITLNNLGE